MIDHPRVTDGVMDLLLFVDHEVDSMAQAMTMAAARCREAAAEAEGIGHLAALFTESAESWERKAERLRALAEHLPDVLDY